MPTNPYLLLDYLQKAVEIYDQLGNKNAKGKAYSKIGLVYFEMGDLMKSLENDLKALKLSEELGDRKETAGPLHNIGMVYEQMKEDSLARVYYQKAKEINIEFNNKSWLIRNLEAIGNGYNGGTTYDEAIQYLARGRRREDGAQNGSGTRDVRCGHRRSAVELVRATGDRTKHVDSRSGDCAFDSPA